MQKYENFTTNALKNVKKHYLEKPIFQIKVGHNIASCCFLRYVLMGKNALGPFAMSDVLNATSLSLLASPWLLNSYVSHYLTHDVD